MIDIHCHMLPAIDDGARSDNESLRLATAAVDNGITHTLCTPHIHFGRFDNSKALIAEKVSGLRALLNKNSIALSVAAAAEVRFDIEILSAIERNEIPFLGHWRGDNVLLLELPTGHFPKGFEQFIRLLKARAVTAMIAHPERNKGILREPKLVSTLIKSGCLLQITAASLTGNFGERIQEFAETMIRENVVDVVASDAHNHKKRPPLLKQAYERIGLIGGDHQAVRLTRATPWIISESLFT